jgi:hypothetical protein
VTVVFTFEYKTEVMHTVKNKKILGVSFEVLVTTSGGELCN